MNTEILGVALQVILMVVLHQEQSILQKSIKDKKHGRTS